jgi:MFS family permease
VRTFPTGPSGSRFPTPTALRATLRGSVVEGMLYAGMVALGELWFVADVVRLGGASRDVILAATLPVALGSVGAVLSLGLLGRIAHRRPLVVGAVVGQAAVLALLSVLTHLDILGPWGVIGLACLYQAFGQAAATGWSSWFGDLVPASIRGRYFGRRTGFVHGATFAGLLAAGLVLHVLEPKAGLAQGAGGTGYAILFAVAAGFRLASAGLLRGAWEPPRAQAAPADPYRAWLFGDGGRAARRLLPAAALFIAAVSLGSPFFVPFELDELVFSYPLYMAVHGVVVLVKLLSLPTWGRAVDAVGPRRIWPIAALLVGLVPVPWLFATGPDLVIVGQVMSGLAWAGYEVSLFSLMLAATPSEQRPRLFATHAVLAGCAQLVGGLTGVLLFTEWGEDYRALFVATMVARLAIVPLVFFAAAGLPSLHRVGFRELALRVVGLRPHGGLTFRPANEGSTAEDRAPEGR